MKKGDGIFLTVAGMIVSIYIYDSMFFTEYSDERFLVLSGGGILLFAGLPWSIYRIIIHLKSKKIKNALQHN